MAHALADETLTDILAQVLDVPYDDFASMASTSPFALRQFSTADTLLVCKRWMRVATPLLYDTVVLRSTAQAQALAKALKKNPAFGVYLKRLRIEGGFGASVGRSMLAAKGMTDLFLTANLTSRDNIKSMCQALPSLRPRRLICAVHGYNLSARSLNLLDSLQSSLPVWTTLKCITFPMAGLAAKKFTTALLSCNNALEELSVLDFWCHPRTCQRLVTVMTKLPGLRVLRLHVNQEDADYIPNFGPHYSKIVFVMSHTKPLTTSASQPSPPTTPASNPGHSPMGSCTSSVQRHIWSEILSTVLFSDIPNDAHDAQGFYGYGPQDHPLGIPMSQQQILRVPGARKYMHVCKLFKDITVELASRAVSLQYGGFEPFAALLDSAPHLSAAARGLFLLSTPPVERLNGLLPAFTGLRRFVTGVDIAVSSLHLLATAAGSTLQHLELRRLSASTATGRLCFLALRLLRVEEFDFYSIVPQWELPVLEELHVKDGEKWLLESLVQLQLPRLAFLTLGDSNFLAAHGSKCTVLRLRSSSVDAAVPLCPHVHILHLERHEDPPSRFEHLAAPHTSLKTIYLPEYSNNGRGQYEMIVHKRWEKFFDFLARDRDEASKLPALSELFLAGFYWPTSPQDIAQCKMVKWAEAMHARGIKVYDVHRTLWRPRLRTRK